MKTTQGEHTRDPAYVREQYARETNLAARASLYGETTGPFAGDVALEAVDEVAPSRLLEVGCGTGWFAARVQRELGADLVGVDQSARMVELARMEGIEAHVGDVQALPFADGSFDCVAANWMLYHVADLDRGLREIARVLSDTGRLVAITNGIDHLLELWRAVGLVEARTSRASGFGAENGAAALAPHFPHVEVRDASGTVRIESRDAVLRYVESTAWGEQASIPDSIDPFTARRVNVVFVADKR
jgi:SAM-dependent methyltransferase